MECWFSRLELRMTLKPLNCCEKIVFFFHFLVMIMVFIIWDIVLSLLCFTSWGNFYFSWYLLPIFCFGIRFILLFALTKGKAEIKGYNFDDTILIYRSFINQCNNFLTNQSELLKKVINFWLLYLTFSKVYKHFLLE